MIKIKSKLLFFLLFIILKLNQINSISLISINKQWIQFKENESEIEIILEFDSDLTKVLSKVSINEQDLSDPSLLVINEKKVTLKLQNETFGNFNGIYNIFLTINDIKTNLNKSLIFSNKEELTKNSIIINHNVLINPSNEEISFNSEKEYENITFEIKCLNSQNELINELGTFFINSGKISFTNLNNQEINTCDFYFDEGNSKLNLNLPFYTFNSIDNYISIIPSFEDNKCYYYDDYNDNSFIIEKKSEKISDDDFKNFITNYNLILIDGSNNLNYIFDNEQFKFSLSENTKFEENKTYNLILKDKENEGIILFEKQNIKFSNIKIPTNKFGYIIEKNVKITLNSLFCDLSYNTFNTYKE